MPAPEDTAGTWRTPRHWSLRVKLAVVLLVPAVLALALGGLRITDQAGEAAELSRVARFAEAQGSVAELLQAVGEERYAAAVFVARDRVDPAGSSAATAETDARAAAAAPVLDALVADVGEIAAPVRQAEQALARLGDVRALVTTSAAPPSAVLARYSDILARLAEVDEALLRGVNTTEVNGLATALAGVGVARSEVTLQFALVSTGSGADPATTAEVQSSEARLRTGLADFRAALDPAQRVRYAALIAGAANTDRARLVQGFLAGQGDAGDPVPVFEAVLAEMDQAEDAMRAELITTSADRRTAATTLAVVNAVLLALALLLGALVVGLVARTMIVSLRTLRTDALDIARRRLPEAVEQMKTVDGEVTPLVVEPIDIDTREEIGEVARAFDAVHAEAVRLAAQQALLRNNVNDIFVNLSRRSQGLVGRQLRLIDELEKSEQDPEHLGNLFQLDHLATRMRRNNENLLVLAGAAELRPRRKRPVAAQDVLRAAVSEVEQYRRVTVRRAPDVAVAGPVVNDLVHLVAELLDNATTFSPPESPVVLDAAWGTGGRLVIEIRDAGVGIEPDELQAINEQLATPPIVDVAVSRRMGLFVVGRLAARHNIAVTLRPAAAGGGLLASVEVPAVYLQNRGPDEARPGPQERPVTVPEQAASAPDLPRRTPSSASASFGSRSFDSASTGSASTGPAPVGSAPGGSAPVGSASARTASTDSTPAGSIGSASTGSGTPGSGSSGTSGSGSFRPATPRPALSRPPLPGAGPDPAVPAPVADAAAATGAHALRAPTPPEQR
ncbi:MAG: nitrate- and nitrite sensing domain-containing protein, partial [Pseudonocardiales bacterium]|nr:nitrate- and nitrite sensing domain-containing protein [Pseudonocardiales bacterium]